MGDEDDCFTVGRFAIPDRDARLGDDWFTPETQEDVEEMQVGQLFRKYGLESQWSTLHRRPSQLQPLRCGGLAFWGASYPDTLVAKGRCHGMTLQRYGRPSRGRRCSAVRHRRHQTFE